jgi:hypothetical protein
MLPCTFSYSPFRLSDFVSLKLQLESHNRIIEQIIGSPLWINEEANFLRKEMHRVITLLMATSYRRVRVTPASLPTPEGSEIWPAAFSVYVLCPGDPTPMPDRPPEKRVTIPRSYSLPLSLLRPVLNG